MLFATVVLPVAIVAKFRSSSQVSAFRSEAILRLCAAKRRKHSMLSKGWGVFYHRDEQGRTRYPQINGLWHSHVDQETTPSSTIEVHDESSLQTICGPFILHSIHSTMDKILLISHNDRRRLLPVKTCSLRSAFIGRVLEPVVPGDRPVSVSNSENRAPTTKGFFLVRGGPKCLSMEFTQ